MYGSMTYALKTMVATLWMSREAKRFLWMAMRGTRRTLRMHMIVVHFTENNVRGEVQKGKEV